MKNESNGSPANHTLVKVFPPQNHLSGKLPADEPQLFPTTLNRFPLDFVF
jgi:hypothetical protein